MPEKKIAAEDIEGTWQLQGKTVTITPEIATLFAKAANEHDWNHEHLIALAGIESDANPTREHETSHAAGLFQFLPSTFCDVVGKYGAVCGVENVEKYVVQKKGRWVRNPKISRSTLMDLAKNPEININLYMHYKKEMLEGYNTWLGNREATAGEIILLNNLGLEGAKLFASTAWDSKGKNILAKDFFIENAINKKTKKRRWNPWAIIKTNPQLVKINKKNATVGAIYNSFLKKGQIHKIEPAPEM